MATKKTSNNKKASPKRNNNKRPTKSGKVKTPKVAATKENKNVNIVDNGGKIYNIDMNIPESMPPTIHGQITDSVTTYNTDNITNKDVDFTLPPPPKKEQPINNEDIIQDNVSYNNMIVPQPKDNTTLYIGAALVLTILLWALFF